MMGMNIIPSIFLEKMRNMEVNEIVEMFDYFKDALPNPDSFVADLCSGRLVHVIFYSLTYQLILFSTLFQSHFTWLSFIVSRLSGLIVKLY